MIFGKPSFISETGALSHITDSGVNQTAFRRNDNGEWDTLIVPNLLNDDLDSIFQIKANYSVSGTPIEETVLKVWVVSAVPAFAPFNLIVCGLLLASVPAIQK